ncbi:MAG: glycosyltransferase family 4 protein [Deltaproteobacteria bacterium]|nr:glycosyltransferase family 4 protein [Deltaproteobacteria bacterium]MBW2661057.1 glycosyltransferase family 4 protein [Deltaproteobacteria bacterium]
MDFFKPSYKTTHIGFVSTRIAGTDGVSLEIAKWANVFEKEGFKCFYFAGELDRPPECSYFADLAHFKHKDVWNVHKQAFGVTGRSRFMTKKIHKIKEKLKDHLYQFVEKFKIDILIPENVLAIPLNIPLGIAITELISETNMPVIAHHHDFFWERQCFKISSVWEYINMAFPPNLPSIKHVVINSSASNQLSFRTGISGITIPNVMDFENPPVPVDDYALDVRESLGIEDDELFILQPTRVVKRKGIELAIELVRRLNLKAKLVISHASGDEGYDYEQRVREYSKMMNVDTIFVSDIINEFRGYTKTGKKIYTLNDIYPHADLITYPSSFEGFGNAFLEAIYFRKPIVVNTYSIYTIDIKPKGFSVIELDGYVTEQAINQTKKVLSDKKLCKKMVDHNYETAKYNYSYSMLHQKLKNVVLEHIACKNLMNLNKKTITKTRKYESTKQKTALNSVTTQVDRVTT